MDQYSMLVELFRKRHADDPTYKKVTVPGNLMYDVEENMTSNVDKPDEKEPSEIVKENDRARPLNNLKLEQSNKIITKKSLIKGADKEIMWWLME